MPVLLDELIRFLDDEEKSIVDRVLQLIKEDAPKNKFSVIAGKRAMIEEVRSKIEALERESHK